MVAFAITGPPIALQKPECSPGCVVPYTQVGTVTGSLTGEITGAGAVGLDGSRYTGATTFVFRGRVEGCGEGTLALRRREAGDLSAKTLRGTWDITAGFGTGSLATVAGEGTIAAPETEPAAGKIASVLHGRVQCDAAKAPTGAQPTTPGAFAATFDARTAPPPVRRTGV